MSSENQSSSTPPMQQIMESPNAGNDQEMMAAAAQQQAMAAASAYQYSNVSPPPGPQYAGYGNPYSHGVGPGGMMQMGVGVEEMGYPAVAGGGGYYAQPYASPQMSTMPTSACFYGGPPGAAGGYPGPSYYDPYGMLNPAACVSPVPTSQGMHSKKKSKKNGNRFCCC